MSCSNNVVCRKEIECDKSLLKVNLHVIYFCHFYGDKIASLEIHFMISVGESVIPVVYRILTSKAPFVRRSNNTESVLYIQTRQTLS